MIERVKSKKNTKKWHKKKAVKATAVKVQSPAKKRNHESMSSGERSTSEVNDGVSLLEL